MVRPRVIDVRAGFARCQIVVADAVTIVDPGNAVAVLNALAREAITLSAVARIVITHGDGDHWQGAADLAARTGAEIAAHEADASYIEGRALPRFSIPKRLLIAASGRRARRPEVHRRLRGGEKLDGLEVIHTPGHTPGHVSLRIGDTLIAGDAFSTGERFHEVPRLMTSDLRASRASIRALAALEIDRAFSGHGPPADGARAKLRALADALPAR
ncbi:MAG TPA: MBL fold metallo-hydrolase [Candidatus Limnocylindria bacterium]|nr:MBL fold metallo-hydrolase [Candidatus Limnocylindria bacterium]